MGGVAVAARPAVGPEAEAGGDQRRVGLDVGAHHQHVAGLERGVVGEQAEQHLAQHLDLAGRAVAGVHLDGAVVGSQGRAAAGPAALARRSACSHWSRLSGAAARAAATGSSTRRDRAQRALELAGVAAERGQQPVADPLVGAVAAPLDGTRRASPASAAHSASEGCGSHRWTSRCSPSAASSSISVDGQAGVAEERDPRGQVDARRGRRAAGSSVAACRTCGGSARHRGGESPPELGLPGEVGGERRPGTVGVAARGPVGDQARPLHGVRREEAREPTGDGVAPPAPQVGLLAGGRPWPRCRARVAAHGSSRRRVDGGQQRPDQGVGCPRVVVAGAGDLGDQRGRRAEVDARADAVGPAVTGAEVVGEALGQPALDALGRAPRPPRSRTGRPAACGGRRRVPRRARRNASPGAAAASCADPKGCGRRLPGDVPGRCGHGAGPARSPSGRADP